MASFEMRFVGATTLPSRLSDFDLHHFFRLSETDIAALNERFRADRRTGAAVLLLFLRASSRPLDPAVTVPRVLLRYVGEALGLTAPTIASLRAMYRRTQTLYAHQLWAKQYLGLKEFDHEANTQLAEYLTSCAQEAVTTDELVAAARSWLRTHHYLIPGERVVKDLARHAHGIVERTIYEAVTVAVTKNTLAHCRNAIYQTRPGNAYTVLEWLKTPPRRHSPTTLTETLDKITFLKQLGVAAWQLDHIPLEKQRGYAQQVQARRPDKSKQIKEEAAVVEMVFFLRMTLFELTDSALYQCGRSVSGLIRKAYLRTETRQASAAVTYRERCLAIKAIVDQDERPAEEQIAKIKELLGDLSTAPAVSHAATVREALVDDSVRVRSLLKAVDTFDFEGRANETTLQNLDTLRQLYAAQQTELPTGESYPVRSVWRDLVDCPDRKRAFHALEASTVMGLTKGLRRGSIWVTHSLSYRERDSMLISPQVWAQERERHLELLGLPQDADTFLQPLLRMIEAGLAAVTDATGDGAVRIGDDGNIHLPKLEALPEDPARKRATDLIFQEIGDVQLSDLMLDVDAMTNFSEVLLGRRADDEGELVALYAALIAHGTEIDAKSVASMIPQVKTAQVSVAMRSLEAQGRLRRANQCVVDFQTRQGIASQWGSGQKASSDMMSLDASQHLWNARVDPRRRTHAIGIYTHVQDRHGVIYDQPIVLNERQAGAAIAGVVDYNSSVERVKLQLLAVDTHGYTNVAMAVSKLLGFDLCPRLRNLSERRLFVPRRFAVPEALKPVIVKDVSLAAIRKGWDELLRLVASIQGGRISAGVAMQRFGSAAHGDAVHKAADHLGKLIRTLYLCDYHANTEFRREIHNILNRGESVHQLQRAVYYGRISHERGRRPDEIIAISGAHILLTNLVIAWNTYRMQEAVDKLRKGGRPMDESWLHHMGPAHFRHINFRGTLKFGVSKYAELLLRSRAASSVRQTA